MYNLEWSEKRDFQEEMRQPRTVIKIRQAVWLEISLALQGRCNQFMRGVCDNRSSNVRGFLYCEESLN